MAFTTTSSGNILKQWKADFHKEYIRKNRFSRYIGMGANSIFQTDEALQKGKGDTVTFQLVSKLDGAGVSGNTLLYDGGTDNMDVLGNHSHPILIDCYRNGVMVTDWEDQKNNIGLYNQARPMLMSWAMEHLRDKIITGLGKVDGVPFATASAANKNAFAAANADRVLFGSAVGNYSATFATGLATVDNTDDKLTGGVISLMKRRAKECDPLISPVTVGEDEETFVAFTGTRAFRDLKEDLRTVHSDAAVRGRNNPLFRDGDLMYDGVIIREIPEIGVIDNGTIDCQPVYLCGRQALGIAYGKRPEIKSDTMDVDFVRRVAVAKYYEVDKLTYTGKDHGVMTAYVAGVADA